MKTKRVKDTIVIDNELGIKKYYKNYEEGDSKFPLMSILPYKVEKIKIKKEV